MTVRQDIALKTMSFCKELGVVGKSMMAVRAGTSPHAFTSGYFQSKCHKASEPNQVTAAGTPVPLPKGKRRKSRKQ